MFDISWTDPTRETVGQRKNRKEQQANGISRGTSIRSSRSSKSSQSQAKPALLSLFGGSKKGGLRRSGSHSKLSVLRNEQGTKASRRISSYTVASGTSKSEPPGPAITTRIPVNGFFAGPPYNADGPQSSSSEGMLTVYASNQLTDKFFSVRVCVFRMDWALSSYRVVVGLCRGISF